MKHILYIPILSLLLSCSTQQPENLSHEETTSRILEKLNEIATISELISLWGQSVIIAATWFLLIGGLTAYIYRQKNNRWTYFWGFLEHNLTTLFALVWFFGFSVYLVGTSIIGDDESFAEILWHLFCQSPIAVVHAFEMFVLESDVSAIHSEFHNSLPFMTCFSLAHFLAVFVSLTFIIKYFGYNLVAKFRLAYASRFGGHFDELYVFWGMNKATYCLAKDIKKTYVSGKKTGSFETIIINTTEDDEEENTKEHTAVERLFSFFSFKKEELNQYNELGCLTENVFRRISKIKSIGDSDDVDILQKEMDATSLVRLIKKTDKKVHIFLLGQDEEENIIGTTILCRDASIKTYAISHNVSIYCHARYDSINRVIEDKYSDGNIEVKVLDSSHESINILRSKPDYHPVNFVDIDTKNNLGTVKSDFTSLVIGFGETGRDAVRYLYEYGAFVSHHSSKEDDNPNVVYTDEHKPWVARSNFRCYIIDKDATKLSGQFFANAPATSGICVWNTDVFTPEFYKNIDTICRELNYVVLALGNDELNITTAVRLLIHIRKHRKDLNNLKLFVRCHNHEQKKHLQHIADHYNQCNCEDECHEHIIVFGTEDELYTYDQVIENDFVDEGRQYNALYCEASGENGPKNQWESRHQILLNKKTLNALSELRRKESQDIANAYHAITKVQIMKKVAEDKNGNVKPEFQRIHDCLENMRFAPKFSRHDGLIEADGDFTEQEQLLFRNLARLEHIRWNAAHEVLGYQSYKDGDPDCKLVPDEGDKRHGCNETFKLHNCLIDWQNLDVEMNDGKNIWHPDYKLYDFVVVTTTFMMHNKRKR